MFPSVSINTSGIGELIRLFFVAVLTSDVTSCMWLTISSFFLLLFQKEYIIIPPYINIDGITHLKSYVHKATKSIPIIIIYICAFEVNFSINFSLWFGIKTPILYILIDLLYYIFHIMSNWLLYSIILFILLFLYFLPYLLKLFNIFFFITLLKQKIKSLIP